MMVINILQQPAVLHGSSKELSILKNTHKVKIIQNCRNQMEEIWSL